MSTTSLTNVAFRSADVVLVGDRLRVSGELTAGGQSVVIDPETSIDIDGDEIRLDVHAKLDQRKLGMTHSPLGMVKTPSTLLVHAVLRRER